MSDPYQISEVSAASPEMSDVEFNEFMEDIRRNGQLVPIVKCGDEIIDGRKRLAACQRLGIKPQVLDVSADQDPVARAYSLNILRTQYPPSQRAMFAAKRATATRGEGPRRRAIKPNGSDTSRCRNSDILKTASEAAREVGVSRWVVQDAKALRR